MTADILMEERKYIHEPVLLKEVLARLVTDPDGVYLDATVGLGGHAEAILKTISAQGKLIGMDMDPEALKAAENRLQPFTGRFRLVHANFRDLSQIWESNSLPPLAGALFDLGVSSLQFDKADKGFSFKHEGPLDMRMDPGQKLSARDIVNEWPAEEIERILREYGEEREAARIARWIASARRSKPFTTTQELSGLIESRMGRRGGLHPATKTFMALRIAVNGELENLSRGLDAAFARLNAGGRLAALSYHSLEDRIVKHLFKSYADAGRGVLVTRSAVRPEESEVEINPRSRSAKLRVVEKR